MSESKVRRTCELNQMKMLGQTVAADAVAADTQLSKTHGNHSILFVAFALTNIRFVAKVPFGAVEARVV